MMKKFLSITLAVIMIFSFTSCGKAEKINLNNYLTYQVGGYDGYGYVFAMFDREKFYIDNADKIKFKSTSEETAYKALYGAVEYPIDVIFENECKYYISKESNLKNGDIVSINWTPNTYLLEKYFDLSIFEFENIEINVDSLGQMQSFDPLDGIEDYIVYNGYNGMGYLTVEKSLSFNTPYGESILSNPFLCMTFGLSNGDVARIEIIESMLQTMREQGYNPVRTYVDIICDGFAEPCYPEFTDIEQTYFDTIDSVIQPEIKKANEFTNTSLKLNARIKDFQTEGYYYFYKEENGLKKSAFVIPIYKIKESFIGKQLDSYNISYPDDIETYYMSVKVNAPITLNGEVMDSNYDALVKTYKDYPKEYVYISCYWGNQLSSGYSYSDERSFALNGFDTQNDILSYYRQKLVGYKYNFYKLK